MLKMLAAAAALVLGTMAPAYAQVETVTAKDPQTVLDALREIGYRGELSKMDSGRSSIAVQLQGIETYIDFYDCADDLTDCYTLLFIAILDLDTPATMSKANDWNAQAVTGKVSIDDEGDPQLDFSLSTYEGISLNVFKENLELWERRVGEMKDFFDF